MLGTPKFPQKLSMFHYKHFSFLTAITNAPTLINNNGKLKLELQKKWLNERTEISIVSDP